MSAPTAPAASRACGRRGTDMQARHVASTWHAAPPCHQPYRPVAPCHRRRCHRQRRQLVPQALASAAADVKADVCIVGAGIIGLCTSLALLRADPQLRVVLVDQAVPCSGATGAGQGYLWLAHRNPASPAWRMAVCSKGMWPELLAPAVTQLTSTALEWQDVGSLLLANTEEESEALRLRQQLLQAAGLEATLMPASQLQQVEQALQLREAGSGLLVPTDAQINGKQTAAAMLAACEAYGDRFRALFHEGAQQLLLAPTGEVEGVQTANHRLHASRGVVAAMGAWTGFFLAQQLGDERWEDAFKPRRGLLLEMPRPEGMPAVKHGMMEVGYTKHYKRSSSSAGPSEAAGGEGNVDITFTATTSASGTLLVGSSREFAGFDKDAPEAIVTSIMQRAAEFLPSLSGVQRQDIYVRAGPRPYATAGTPMVGPVPGAKGSLLVAAGHEGSGLTLAPATADLIVAQLLGKEPALESDVVDSLRVPY